MVKSAYIHIPFCKSKCKYCTFVSYPFYERVEDYISALSEEIRCNYNGEKLNTLYIGGGTPSLLKINYIERILNLFDYDTDYELTIELNPDDLSLAYLKELKKLGINRLSIGSQTFNDKILSYINRRHNAKQIYSAVEYAQNSGFENISLDLIYGLPFQTTDILKDDLKVISSLGIKHISTYGLKIEEASYFYNNLPENLPSDDEQADMYIYINDYLNNKNFYRYEFSNFSQKGYESRHNLNYWNNSEYYGFGISAHGYVNRVRYSNAVNFDEYIKQPNKRASAHNVSKNECLEEEIFLGFRKAEGINIIKINEKYDIDFENKYRSVLSKYDSEYIEKTPEGYKLTLQGVLLSNIILAEFLN